VNMNYVSRVLFLLSVLPCNLFAMDFRFQLNSNAQLMLHSSAGDLDGVRNALFQEGATFDPINGVTALDVALIMGHVDVAVELLSLGTPITKRTPFWVLNSFGLFCKRVKRAKRAYSKCLVDLARQQIRQKTVRQQTVQRRIEYNYAVRNEQSYRSLLFAFLNRIVKSAHDSNPISLDHIFWMSNEDGCGNEVQEVFRALISDVLMVRTRQHSRKFLGNSRVQQFFMRQLNG